MLLNRQGPSCNTMMLPVFISGLKRNLTDVLFAAHPPDLSLALALAQEVEANHERYTFAASFARGQKERGRAEPRPQGRKHKKSAQGNQCFQGKNPHFKKQAAPQADKAQPKQGIDSTPVPREVDPSSSKFSANFQRSSGRLNGSNKRTEDDARYVKAAQEVAAEIEEENGHDFERDSEGPCCRSYGGE